jgi:hypothetical protein
MKNMMKRLLALALAAVTAASLAGCTIDLTGKGDEEENDTKIWAQASSNTITLPEGMDSSARFSTQLVDNSMYVVFNGIQKRDSGYFSAPNGSLTFTTVTTAESEKLQQYKVAVWKLVDGGTQYVNNTTVYFKTDGTAYSYTVDGLDASARYRLTLSYDSSKYYMYGQLRVDGIGEMGAAPAESDAASSGAAA